jgi:hypothetical protein
MNNRGDRARVYEQVLREGTEDDVRFYIDADGLQINSQVAYWLSVR